MTNEPVKLSQEHESWVGAAVAQQLPVTEEDFVQAAILWEVLGKQPGQQDNLVGNVAVHSSAAKPAVRNRTYEVFTKINRDLGKKVEQEADPLAPYPQRQAAGNAQARL